MEQKLLSSVDGVGIYGVISILIFFTFFTGMLLWAWAQKKSDLDRMGRLPLDSGEKNSHPNP